MTDEELERGLQFLAQREKHNLPQLLTHLAEYDSRQLCVKKWHSDLYGYCIRTLKFEDGDAFRRIRAARVLRKWPEVLEKVESGLLHLSALVCLAPILTNENRGEWFQKAAGRTRREIEALIAREVPSAARPDWARRMPAPGGWTLGAATPPSAVDVLPGSAPAIDGPAAGDQAPKPGEAGPAMPAGPGTSDGGEGPSGPGRTWEWQAMVPLGMDRVRIGFDAAAAMLRLIERARQVLRHKYPAGRIEDVVREALETFLDRKDPQRKLALKPAEGSMARDAADEPSATAPPASASSLEREIRSGRYIPAKVKQAVWARDDGRCAWRDCDGVVCGSKDWIEFDHIVPFAKGGRSEVRNVRLLCRLHNRVAAYQAFGELPGPRQADGIPELGSTAES